MTAVVWTPGTAVPAPLNIYTCKVEQDWVDYNGHMTEAAYLTAMGWGSDALFTYIGDNDEYRAAGNSFYTVETHIVYEDEAFLNQPLHCTTLVLDIDPKRMHFYHELFNTETGKRLSNCEQMLVHVDTNTGKSSPMGSEMMTKLKPIGDAHAKLPQPVGIGRRVGEKPAK